MNQLVIIIHSGLQLAIGGKWKQHPIENLAEDLVDAYLVAIL